MLERVNLGNIYCSIPNLHFDPWKMELFPSRVNYTPIGSTWYVHPKGEWTICPWPCESLPSFPWKRSLSSCHLAGQTLRFKRGVSGQSTSASWHPSCFKFGPFVFKVTGCYNPHQPTQKHQRYQVVNSRKMAIAAIALCLTIHRSLSAPRAPRTGGP